jgi:hypothetical protein
LFHLWFPASLQSKRMRQLRAVAGHGNPGPCCGTCAHAGGPCTLRWLLPPPLVRATWAGAPRVASVAPGAARPPSLGPLARGLLLTLVLRAFYLEVLGAAAFLAARASPARGCWAVGCGGPGAPGWFRPPLALPGLPVPLASWHLPASCCGYGTFLFWMRHLHTVAALLVPVLSDWVGLLPQRRVTVADAARSGRQPRCHFGRGDLTQVPTCRPSLYWRSWLRCLPKRSHYAVATSMGLPPRAVGDGRRPGPTGLVHLRPGRRLGSTD